MTTDIIKYGIQYKTEGGVTTGGSEAAVLGKETAISGKSAIWFSTHPTGQPRFESVKDCVKAWFRSQKLRRYQDCQHKVVVYTWRVDDMTQSATRLSATVIGRRQWTAIVDALR